MKEEKTKFVSESMLELSSLLKKPPTGIILDTKPLSAELVNVVESTYNSWCEHNWQFCFFCKNIYLKLKSIESIPIHLLIYCSDDSKLANAARKENKLAKWGLVNDKYHVAAVYKSNDKYILWHEILHLFAVDDCYLPDNPYIGPTCELPNCIMQYVPSKENVREWPFLCQENIKRIQAHNGKQTSI